MERKELIRQLLSVKLDNGNPIQWVHLICEAAEMLEEDEKRSCVGCVYHENALKCTPESGQWNLCVRGNIPKK